MVRKLAALAALMGLLLSGCGNAPVQPVIAPISSSASQATPTVPSRPPQANASQPALAPPGSPSIESASEPVSSVADPVSTQSAAESASEASSYELGQKPSIAEQLADLAVRTEDLIQKADAAQPAGRNEDDDWDTYQTLALEVGRLEDRLARLGDEWADLNRDGTIRDTEHLEIQAALTAMEQRLVIAQEELRERFSVFA